MKNVLLIVGVCALVAVDNSTLFLRTRLLPVTDAIYARFSCFDRRWRLACPATLFMFARSFGTLTTGLSCRSVGINYAGSGQCDRFCSKISVLAGLPMMP